MTKPLATGRMQLEPLSASGTNGIFKVFSDSRHTYALPQLSHKQLAATQATLQQGVEHPDGYCWAIVAKDADEVVGYVSLLRNVHTPRLMFLIHPDFWGRGYAPEACRAVLHYAFDALAYERVEMWIEASNTASMRVAQKLDFCPLGQVKIRDENSHHYQPTMIYGLEASAWRGEPQAVSTLGFVSIEPVLQVADLEASVAFYGDKLGFRADGDPSIYRVRVTRGDWSHQQSGMWLERANQPPPVSCVRINVVGALATLYDEFQAVGVTVVQTLQREADTLFFGIADPDGHTLLFATHG